MEIGFYLAALFSEVVGTVVGFGSSTLFLPLALIWLDFKSALVLVAFLHIFGNLARAGFFGRKLDFGVLWRFGIPSVMFSVIGALLVPIVPQNLLKSILGLFLIVYSCWFLVGKRIKMKESEVNIVIGGGLSGLLAGLIGTGGAMRSLFLSAFGLKKESYVATMAVVALVVDLIRIPVYLNQGLLEAKYYGLIPILLVIALVGSYTGRLIVKKIPQEKFSKIVAIAILLVGMKFLVDWF